MPSPAPPLSPSRRAVRATRIAVAGAAGLVTGALVLPPLFGLFLHGLDLVRSDLGVLCAMRRALASGGPWLLSAEMGNGAAFFARPETQPYYPIRWLLLTLPIDWALTLTPAIHLAIGAASAAWLARTFRLRPLPALAAGCAFALSGTALELIHHSQYIVGAAYLPLVWAAARRWLHPRGARTHLAAVVAGLLGLLLGGEPQGFVVACALVVAEGLARSAWRAPRRRRAAILFAALPASFAVALVAWLPTLAEAALSSRAGGMSSEELLFWSLTPRAAIGAVLPGAVAGKVQPLASLWRVLTGPGAIPPWNPDPYFGALFLAALLAGLRQKRTRVASVVFAVGLVLALGDTLPVLPLLQKVLPPLRLFRYPVKYLLVTTLAGAMIAAGLLELLRRDARARRRLAIAGAPFVLGLLGVLAFVSARSAAIDAAAAAVGADTSKAAGYLPTLSEALTTAALHSLFPLAAALVFAFTRASLRRWIPVLLVADLLFAAPKLLSLGPPLARAVSPLTAIAGTPKPIFCLDSRLLSGAYVIERGSWEAGANLYRRLWGVPETQACDGLISAMPYSPLAPGLAVALVNRFANGSLAAARALGCTHIASNQTMFGPLVRVPIPSPDRAVQVVEVPDPLPETFVAQAPRLMVTEDEAATAVVAAAGAQDAVRVLDDPLHRLAPGASLPSGADVRVVRLDWPIRTRARLELGGTGGAVVGLKTIFQVGWGARQAGRDLPIVRAAGMHLAIVVADASAGPVELEYALPRCGLGVLGSLAGLLALGVVFAVRRR